MKISVITYVKNGLPYVKECICSIRNQTLHDIEIIIVDAESKDGTTEFLHHISSLDDRIKVISTESSVGKQFNKALTIATGKYIAICEADDFILPDAYEKLWNIADETNCDVIRSDYEQFIGSENNRICFRTHCSANPDFYNKILYNSNKMFLQEGVNGFWSGLYKRDFLLENSIYMSETLGASYQDVGFSFKCQCMAKTMYFCDQVFYQYRLDNPNASMNVKNRVSKMLVEFSNLEKWLKEKHIWSDFINDYFQWEVIALKKTYMNLKEQEKKEMLELILKTIQEQILKDKTNGMDYNQKMKLKDYITNQDAEQKKTKNFFNNIINDKRKIVIFGVGFLGQVVSKIVTFMYKSDFLFVDNDVSLQGTYKNEHEILSLKKVLDINEDLVFIIANVNHANDIREQLLNNRVDIKDIYICNNDEFLLREVLIKYING